MIKEEMISKINKAVEDSKEKVSKDYYRLKYHLMPIVGFMNDPNGFIKINGEYHLFYQFNPFYPQERCVCWAHVKSKDLINWEALPLALLPLEWYETHGCYSGSAVNHDGIFTLMYTGNVKNSEGIRETYQCLAESKDGVEFVKNKNNPVIYNQPEGYTTNFRDPKLWKNNGTWYMVIGTQTEKKQGTTLLYKSTDLLKWLEVGEVASSKDGDLGFLGYMWECPNLFRIDGMDILLFCPQGVEANGNLYNNIYQCGYLMGNLNYNTGKLNHGDFVELDRGFEFYAPQITVDNNGRTLMVGWVGLPEEESPTKMNKWMHCLTIIRELFIMDNKLCQRPAKEMKLLRKNKITYDDVKLSSSGVKLPNVNGDSYELICEFTYEVASVFGLKLRCNDYEDQGTILYYHAENEALTLSRGKSRFCKIGTRSCYVKNSGKLKLHIFMDKSSIEIFVNDGKETFTSRIYPKKENKEIILFSENKDVKANVEFWNI